MMRKLCKPKVYHSRMCSAKVYLLERRRKLKTLKSLHKTFIKHNVFLLKKSFLVPHRLDPDGTEEGGGFSER